MDAPYSFEEVEAKWRARWERDRTFEVQPANDRPKFYGLEFFPYPSGAGLSVGHCRNYIPADAYCRFKSMNGYNVLHPIGWDAFGQPAENEAIKRGRNPSEMIPEYAANYRRTLKRIGCSYDWSREINSSDPEYYRWTQWFFLLLHRRGLAYRSVTPINWCPSCKTGLANEEVKQGHCWRCDSDVEKRPMPQWYFRITAYADRLLADLETIDWPAHVKQMQREWIGRSEANGQVAYKLRDWLISRQRYWGAPIPIVYCAACGDVPVPEEQLPVVLPYVEHYQPASSGESPLAMMPEFVETNCPRCGGPARRETDTMGGFACSSWYFLRFADPHNATEFASRDALRRWLPVDMYVGGAEHAVMHLLYARFWTKVIYDAGLIDVQEPFQALRTQGSLLAYTPGHRPRVEDQTQKKADAEQHGDWEDWIVLKPDERDTFPAAEIVWRWTRMSKSKGNVVTPESVSDTYGADTLRVYTLFVAPFEDSVQWNEESIAGAARFLNRVWRWVNAVRPGYDPNWRATITASTHVALRRAVHQTICRVTQAVERFSFNTAVAALMELVNTLCAHPTEASPAISEAAESLVLLLAPFAPYMADELWERLGQSGSAYNAVWPAFDPALASEPEITWAVQINGKVREHITVAGATSGDEVKAKALADPRIVGLLEGKAIRRMIVVPGRLINIVTG